MPVNRCPQKAAEEALSVLLQHHSFETDIICSISGVCRTWQAAVQQLQAGQLVVTYTADHQQPAKSMSRLTSLLTWLSKYPNLVGSLDVKLPDDKDLYEAVEQRLALRLQQATAVVCSSSSTPRGMRQLQLHHMTALLLATPRLLTALPPSSLTSLHMTINKARNSYFQPNAKWGMALGALSGLRRLVLVSHPWALPADCLDHISSMSQLSCLILDRVDEDGTDGMWHIPASLQELELTVNFDNEERGICRVIDIQHLTALTQLLLDSTGLEPLSVSGALPEHLQVLNIGQLTFEHGNYLDAVASLRDLHVTQLQHLTELCLSCVNYDSSEELLPIAGMTTLQHLELWYDLVAAAAATAPAWKQLPQLQCIRIKSESSEALPTMDLDGLMEQLAAATSLTSLQLKAIGSSVDVCKHITGLSRLQELVIEPSQRCTHGPDLTQHAILIEDDALQLSKLTALTHLEYGHLDDPDYPTCEGMGDMVAVALACHLTNLRHWNLNQNSLTTAAVVPIIGLHLKHLTELDLRYNAYKFSDREVSRLLSWIPGLRVHV